MSEALSVRDLIAQAAYGAVEEYYAQPNDDMQKSEHDLVADAVLAVLADHDAQVRAEALREAARGMRPGIRGGTCNKACHEADKITLEVRADRIEREVSS